MKQREWLFIAIALLGASAYLGFAAVRGIFGFPLDDGWIHQVYARNLATRGEFAFFAGQPSAGSTAPLWTILLAVGYVLHLDFRIWTYFIGALLLGVSAILAARLAEQILTQYATRNTFHVSRFTSHGSLVALFLLPEWHLAWSAVSGMEIPLFVFLSLLLLERFVARAHSLLLGCLAALLTLTRPEGIVLAALIGIAIALDATRNTQYAIRLTPHTSRLRSHVSPLRLRSGHGFTLSAMQSPSRLTSRSTSPPAAPSSPTRSMPRARSTRSCSSGCRSSCATCNCLPCPGSARKSCCCLVSSLGL